MAERAGRKGREIRARRKGGKKEREKRAGNVSREKGRDYFGGIFIMA